MAGSKHAAGVVDLMVDGTTYTLRPSLRAAQALSRAYGGFAPLLDRLRQMDLDAYSAVIVQGAGLERREARDVPEAIYSAGMADIMVPCVEFVAILANGGKPLADDDDGDDAAPSGKA